jgi:hypothetical protein
VLPHCDLLYTMKGLFAKYLVAFDVQQHPHILMKSFFEDIIFERKKVSITYMPLRSYLETDERARLCY